MAAVASAAGSLPCVERASVSIAATPVTLPTAITEVQRMIDYNKATAYQSAMAQARIMLSKGLISPEDIVSIEDRIAQKYALKFGSICRDMDLINTHFRANMSTQGGGISG